MKRFSLILILFWGSFLGQIGCEQIVEDQHQFEEQIQKLHEKMENFEEDKSRKDQIIAQLRIKVNEMSQKLASAAEKSNAMKSALDQLRIDDLERKIYVMEKMDDFEAEIRRQNEAIEEFGEGQRDDDGGSIVNRLREIEGQIQSHEDEMTAMAMKIAFNKKNAKMTFEGLNRKTSEMKVNVTGQNARLNRIEVELQREVEGLNDLIEKVNETTLELTLNSTENDRRLTNLTSDIGVQKVKTLLHSLQLIAHELTLKNLVRTHGLCCETVKVTASTTSNVTSHQKNRLGTYRKNGLNPLRNSTLTYKHASRAEYLYFYEPTDRWMVGPAINTGSRGIENRNPIEGLLQVCPEGITTGWSYYDGKSFHNDDTLKVICVKK